MANYFSRQSTESINTVAAIYAVNPQYLRQGIIVGGINYDVAASNLTNLLQNEAVIEMLSSARKKVFFRYDPKSPEARFSNFLGFLAGEVASYYRNDNVDFSVLTNFTEMWRKVRSYIRKESSATEPSKRIKSGLREVLSEHKVDLTRTEMTFNLLGSVRYGDAQEYSDIDGDFIILANEDKFREQRIATIAAIDNAVDEKFSPPEEFKPKNQIRDGVKIIDLSDYAALLTDIEDEATVEASDYTSSGDLFYPYDWLLQGEDLLQLPTIGEEISAIKNRMEKAALLDPFFEFLLCYKMFGTIQKREENLSRQ